MLDTFRRYRRMQNYQTLAQLIWTSRVAQAALCMCAALISITFAGYYFGTFDQAIHIPFLKKYADPTLFPNDPFFELRHVHYSFFWFPLIWLYQYGWLEIGMFIIHVMVTFGTFWALYELSKTLFNDPLASSLTVAGALIPHAGFAGFTLIEFSLLNRTFVLPFLLMALTFYVRERKLMAFALLGMLYNLHVVSVNFALAMILFDCLLRIRRDGIKIPAIGMVLFITFALPVLIWRLSSGQQMRGVDWEWFNLLANSYFYHLFYFVGPYPVVIAMTTGGIATAVIFFCARRATPAVRADETIRNFVIAALLVVAVQIVASHVYPVGLFVQAQIMRAGVFVMLFAYLYFAAYLAARFRDGMIQGTTFGLLTATMILSILPAVLLAVWGLLRWVSPPRLARALSVALLAVSFTTTVALLSYADIWRPRLAVYPQQTPWYETQLWARNNTPRDAVFITPPHRWWFYEPEWRVGAERSTVVTLSELLEVAFEPKYVPRWQERFAVLAPGVEARLQGDALANNEMTAEAFYSLTTEQLVAAGTRFGASYLVVEKPHTHNLPLVYQNEEFAVYALPR